MEICYSPWEGGRCSRPRGHKGPCLPDPAIDTIAHAATVKTWKQLAVRLAQAHEKSVEECSYCYACDCHEHAEDCPVPAVLAEA